MNPRIWFCLPLVLSGLVLSEEHFGEDIKSGTSFQDFALSAICDVKCLQDKSADCKNAKCQQNPQNVTVLSEGARANGRLVCRSGKVIIMTQNPGTFVIERLLENNTTEEVFVRSDKFWWNHLEISKSYRYRFHRVFSTGVSKPEVTAEILGIDDSTRVHMPVENISVEIVDSIDTVSGRISAEISFEPTEDHTCFYRVSCRQGNGGYKSVKEILHYDVFRIRFDDLPLDSNLTVTVHAKLLNGHVVNTSYDFTTPPGADSFGSGAGNDLNLPTPALAKTFGRASLMGAIVAMSIGILGFAGYCFFRFRKQLLRPFQTTRRHSEVDKYEISTDRLTMTQVLGKGAFSVVKLGLLRDDQGQTTAVAVKMMRDDAIPADLGNFKLEIELVKSVGKHPNIISFLGFCTIGPQPLIVMEYCSRGDLQTFLRTVKYLDKFHGVTDQMPETISGGVDINIHDSLTGQATVADVEIVTMIDMLNYGRQIATGMEFLSLKRVVHRDLAARNILVCDNGVVKISDFGMSREVYLENVYRKQGIGQMPLKWMAIEALTHQVFSTHSDVWSFGVLLWEISTMGGDPYPGIPTIDILNFLESGNRMERPASCSIPLYDVMLSCWQATPQSRPSFTVLREDLDKLISINTECEYMDVNDIPDIISSADGN